MERSLTHIALFAALIAVFGLVPSIQLSFGVPVSAQSLAIMLCGTVLGAKRGTLAVLLLLALVAAGLPLLAGGRGGLGVFTSPTSGYIVGFVLGAFTTGFLVERTTLPLGIAATAAALIGGVGVVTLCGIVGMSLTLGKTLGEAAYLSAAFLPGDILKAVLAGLITVSLARMRPASVLSRA